MCIEKACAFAAVKEGLCVYHLRDRAAGRPFAVVVPPEELKMPEAKLCACNCGAPLPKKSIDAGRSYIWGHKPRGTKGVIADVPRAAGQAASVNLKPAIGELRKQRDALAARLAKLDDLIDRMEEFG